MKKTKKTEIILLGEENVLSTDSIDTILPYNVGDKFYYSERDCPAYYTKLEDKLMHQAPLHVIGQYIKEKEQKIKVNHIRYFEVVRVFNSTQIEYKNNGKKELQWVKTLIVRPTKIEE